MNQLSSASFVQKTLLFVLLAGWQMANAQRFLGITQTEAPQASRADELETLISSTIFFEGFDNVSGTQLPGGWSSYSNSGQPFVCGTAGEGAGQCNENGFWPVPQHGIFAFANDDVCNCDRSNDRLNSPSVNLGGLDSLFLIFDAYLVGSAGEGAWVEISHDGDVWQTLLNLSWANHWQSYSVAIPSGFYTSHFQWRFRYDDVGNYAAGLAIDNVRISAKKDQNIALTSAYVSTDDVQSWFQFFNQIPATQLRSQPLRIAPVVFNQNPLAAAVTTSFNQLGAVTQSAQGNEWTVNAQNDSTLNFNNGLNCQPHKTGEYEWTLNLSAESDDVGTDNSLISQFLVGDSLFALQAMKNDGTGIVIGDTNDRAGLRFDFFADDSLTALYVKVHESTTAGTRFRVKFFNSSNLSASLFSTPAFTIGSAHIGDTMRVALNRPLSAGSYIAVVERADQPASNRLILSTDQSFAPELERSLYFSSHDNHWRSMSFAPHIWLATSNSNECNGYVVAEVSPVSCPGSTNGKIAATGFDLIFPWTFSWSNGSTNTDTIENLASGEYQLVVVDGNNCIQNFHYTLQEPAAFSATVAAINPTCGQNNGSVIIKAQGLNAPHQFTFNGDTVGNFFQQLSSGTYSVGIIDANGCEDNFNFNLEGSLALQMPAYIKRPGCGSENGIAASIPDGTPPYTFLWSTGDTNDTLFGLSAGVYTVSVSDQASCHATATMLLNDSNAAHISLQEMSEPACPGYATGGIVANVSGGTQPLTLLWSTGASDAFIGALTAGSYTLTVSDAAGCQSFLVTRINEPVDTFSLNLYEKGNWCGDGAAGELAALPKHARGNVGFAWSNGLSTQIISGLEGGLYAVTATDENGCIANGEASLVKLPRLSLIADSIVHEQLQIDSVTSIRTGGSAYFSVYGGTPPFDFRWNNGSRTLDLLDADTGEFTLTVTDQLGCPASDTVHFGEFALSSQLLQVHKELVLYPNPVEANSMVRLNTRDNFDCTFLDACGRVVMICKSEDGALQTPTKAGFYWVQLTAANAEHTIPLLVR